MRLVSKWSRQQWKSSALGDARQGQCEDDEKEPQAVRPSLEVREACVDSVVVTRAKRSEKANRKGREIG